MLLLYKTLYGLKPLKVQIEKEIKSINNVILINLLSAIQKALG